MSAKKKAAKKEKRVSYVATVHVVGSISAVGQDVVITRFDTRRRANWSGHAGFSFADKDKLFVGAFSRLARAALGKMTRYRYKDKPRLKAVAERFARKRLGAGWSVSATIPSCWTGNGWAPKRPNEPCGSFPLQGAGNEELVLHQHAQGRTITLRFYVCVHIAEV